ncbi:MAG: flagellar biosynthesis anti-sigma factor FlgM [Bdellovibrionia bacterium]
MKVTDKTAAGLTGIAGGSVKKTGLDKNLKGEGTVSKEKLSDSAKVDLSTRAQDIKKAKDIASRGLDTVDDAKVAKFQALIDSGKYKVDAKRVADKLVDEQLSTMRAESDEE